MRGETVSRPGAAAAVQLLDPRLKALGAALLHPPVSRAALPVWFRGKVLEVLAEAAFEKRGEPEAFCTRQKRLARERVATIKTILERDLGETPSLEQLGREAGCSPFYLSRIFSQETGTTIPRYLRQIRIERAAELLRAGTHNVTEAAMEVGYSSLSHFSKAFCETIGCCPMLYPKQDPADAHAG
jgi:AraC-like DNA-binding protein